MRCERLGREHAEKLSALFERSSVPCHCRYWHFPGDKNEWLARCAFEVQQNRLELAEMAGSAELQGMVAFDGEALIGWMKMAPASTVPKLYEQRPYRGLPCFAGDRSGTYAVGCFLVDEPYRRRGVARALLAAGLEAVRRAGGSAVEVFPRRVELPSDAELWNGPIAIFEQAGFEAVSDFRAYPVLRLKL